MPYFDMILSICDDSAERAFLRLTQPQCEIAKWVFPCRPQDDMITHFFVRDVEGIEFYLKSGASLEDYRAKAAEFYTTIDVEFQRLYPLMEDYRKIQRLEALTPVESPTN